MTDYDVMMMQWRGGTWCEEWLTAVRMMLALQRQHVSGVEDYFFVFFHVQYEIVVCAPLLPFRLCTQYCGVKFNYCVRKVCGNAFRCVEGAEQKTKRTVVAVMKSSVDLLTPYFILCAGQDWARVDVMCFKTSDVVVTVGNLFDKLKETLK